MNFKQYFKNLGFLFFINLSIKPIWVFGIERKFQLLLGQNQYGLYFSLLSWVYILSVLLDLGLHSFTVKSVSEEQSDGKTNLGRYFYAKTILILIYVFVTLLSVYILKLDSNSTIVFLMVSFMQLLFSIYQYFRNIIQGFQLYKLDSTMSSLDRVFLIVLGVALIFNIYNDISLYNFIILHIIAYIASILVISIIIVRNNHLWYFSVDEIDLKKIIVEATPLIVIQILMTIYTRIDATILKYFHPDGLKECGDLAYSFRFVDSAYNALMLLSIFFLPTVSKNFKEKNYDYIEKLTKYLFILSIVIALLYSSFCFIFSKDIYRLLYKTTDIKLVEIIKYQIWTVLGVALMYVSGSHLTGIGAFKVLISILFLCVIISLCMNFYLIPTRGALGAAQTSLVVQSTVGALQTIASLYYIHKYKNNIS